LITVAGDVIKNRFSTLDKLISNWFTINRCYSAGNGLATCQIVSAE
jgi:hypothetical protein